MTFAPSDNYIPAEITTDADLAAQEGLGRGPVRDRRTLSSAMYRLIFQMSQDAQFRGVRLGESNPDEEAVAPRVSWRLKSRTAGAGGQNRKHAYVVEEVPLENGRVLIKSRQPMSFEMAFEVDGVDAASADLLRDDLEFWLFDNKYVISAAGIEMLVFKSEAEPATLTSRKGGQPLYRRVLYYEGIIQYLHAQVLNRLQSIRIWHPNSEVTLQTLPVVRQTAGDDLFPVPGPVVVTGVHDIEGTVRFDYLKGVDWDLFLDSGQYGPKFYLRWLPRGRNPLPSDTYYVTYYLPDSRHLSTTLISESDGSAPSLPIGAHGRVRRCRPPLSPIVQGQQIDAEDDERGRSIVFASDQPGDSVVPISVDQLDAIIRSSTTMIAVLDPHAFL